MCQKCGSYRHEATECTWAPYCIQCKVEGHTATQNTCPTKQTHILKLNKHITKDHLPKPAAIIHSIIPDYFDLNTSSDSMDSSLSQSQPPPPPPPPPAQPKTKRKQLFSTPAPAHPPLLAPPPPSPFQLAPSTPTPFLPPPRPSTYLPPPRALLPTPIPFNPPPTSHPTPTHSTPTPLLTNPTPPLSFPPPSQTSLPQAQAPPPAKSAIPVPSNNQTKNRQINYKINTTRKQLLNHKLQLLKTTPIPAVTPKKLHHNTNKLIEFLSAAILLKNPNLKKLHSLALLTTVYQKSFQNFQSAVRALK
ncbi:extensin-like [Haliotis rufescens]|uniref:extensin-like n=1 Tax=Haliotis rufescens TaxID=6454 RepID=UPI00201E9DB7|nr:extensin-like [Haliotis rufescens]XP_048259380.1 extensin-like [Haliotis rufescens]